MSRLAELIGDARIECVWRSQIGDDAILARTQCLVLDTIGELKDFYAAGSVAYVGRDHNILEPLTFGKPVTVSPGWDARYPSYPVYQVLKESIAISELSTADAIASSWTHAATQAHDVKRSADLFKRLDQLRGAADRSLTLAAPLLR